MVKKVIGKSTLFIALFLVITLFLGQFFGGTKNDTLDGFYYEKQNTMDVLFFGSSHAYCDINPQIIWQEAGIPSYNLGQPEQQIWTTYYFMKEALKYQKPKVMMMDVLTVNYDSEYMPIENSNINLDDLKLSTTKLENIHTSVAPKDRPYFLFKLLKNKERWKQITKDNFTTNFTHLKHNNKGYREETGIYENERPQVPKTTESVKLPDKVELYLNKIIALSKEEGIPLVLMKTPCYVSEEAKMRYNRVKEIAKENDIPFIDFNEKYEELGIDFKVDYLDEMKHFNFRGAEKLSKYLANYLKENYALQNRMQEAEYTEWNVDLERWQKRDEELRLRQEKDLEAYLNRLIDSKYKADYTVMLTIKNEDDGLNQNGEDKVLDKLIKLGYVLDNEKLKDSYYIGVLKNQSMIYEAYGDNQISFEEELEAIKLKIGFVGGQSSIRVNDTEVSKNKGNVNIAIYDKVVNRVIDSSSFELGAINNVKR